jgi:hypothetical protein
MWLSQNPVSVLPHNFADLKKLFGAPYTHFKGPTFTLSVRVALGAISAKFLREVLNCKLICMHAITKRKKLSLPLQLYEKQM